MSKDITSTANEDLYSRLSLTPEATTAEIKKSYHRLALQYHPDKHTKLTLKEREEATRKFQYIGYAYAILSDPKKRETYDKTGDTEGLDGLENLDKEGWDAFFKELWSGTVTSESIEEFRTNYQGSSEERNELIETYKKYKGDMNKIMQHITCGSVEDESRFIEILQAAILSKEITSYKKFITTTSETAKAKRKKEAESEAQEAEEMAKKLGLDKKLLKDNGNDEDHLKQIIQSRSEKRMSALLENLESKYVNNKSKKLKTNKAKSKKNKFIKLMANRATRKGEDSKTKNSSENAKSNKSNGTSRDGKVGRSNRSTK
ncbi:6949_t:CDS:2 [Diversispora eburnea]|uniref:6949_t:CDS:1 n=1 Tax=Diversispora eburnea TaxID=1213867 RepID=A0A9N9AVX0_9GLOM|nr:6949_t:CDS:2 [Diversispora eburnea]